ncbi:hypothetical protein AB3Y40_19825 [Yoonia sp. R2331]|uniref:hypothetical protein n=1 Tax=Yoonia sp. R2331 TaxID=3237238 RepID=UPI0034E556BA
MIENDILSEVEAQAIRQLDMLCPDTEITLQEAMEQAGSALHQHGFRRGLVLIEGQVDDHGHQAE